MCEGLGARAFPEFQHAQKRREDLFSKKWFRRDPLRPSQGDLMSTERLLAHLDFNPHLYATGHTPKRTNRDRDDKSGQERTNRENRSPPTPRLKPLSTHFWVVSCSPPQATVRKSYSKPERTHVSDTLRAFACYKGLPSTRLQIGIHVNLFILLAPIEGSFNAPRWSVDEPTFDLFGFSHKLAVIWKSRGMFLFLRDPGLHPSKHGGGLLHQRLRRETHWLFQTSAAQCKSSISSNLSCTSLEFVAYLPFRALS